MITFTISLIALVLGYLLYGRFVERIISPDDRVTPAVSKTDGVDFIVLPNWKVFMIQFLNIAGTIILCDPHRAVVIGSGKFNTLRATNMVSPDIRAGIAMLIAAMGAKGTSRIQNINQIDRGYENIDGRLNKLGARIIRINE